MWGNFLSSKQRVISHLIKTQKQTLNSQTTLWGRKCSVNGCLVPEESSSTVSFKEGLSLNSDHSWAILNELPIHEGVSSASSLSQSGSGEKLPNVSPNDSHWYFETSRQATCFYNGDNVNITNCPDSDSDSNIISCMYASYTSYSDCSSSRDTDCCSSETDLSTSSDESDMEELKTNYFTPIYQAQIYVRWGVGVLTRPKWTKLLKCFFFI